MIIHRRKNYTITTEINKIFKDFYANLYSQTNNPNQEYIDTFLGKIYLPQPFSLPR